ncbi:extracellular catalytic domain type 2 short-chain-length polyhydroxyalkanoate depolymerase [Nocardia crassostreae]|uniref:extracellular catalytic domain type 2 short-chain-length polyhydroxyalkanoate depolymerase n=1 Tax=Nocardia crassostreae TaxID=53428 RepID=UPI000AD4A66E|nr:PHB depolymerase family esterase [Nocardia crassostreae]
MTATPGVFAAVPAPTPGELRGHDIDSVYVSGISSGGYMANQLHVAYSGTFSGAGIFSAGPYRCAGDFDYAVRAQTGCMQNGARKTPAELAAETRTLATSGKVDAPANLSGDPVYLYHGTSDQTVLEPVNNDLATYYSEFGANVTYDKSGPAGHAWVSPIGPVACASTASPFVNDCDSDPVGDMLGKLTGGVAAPAATLGGKLVQFDQNAYAPGGNANAISMDAKAFAYVPQSCTDGATCTLMVALHGCKQGFSYQGFGDAFMKYAYLNEYADTNAMIVLYPQAIPLSTASTTNPNGCWNWWGYGGDAAYAWHGGKQMESIMSMVAELTSGTTPPTTITPPTTTPPPTTTTPPTTTDPAPACVTASNYAHTTAGRAYAAGGYTYANGSKQNLGLWNTFTQSTIKETSPGYWEKC